MLKRIAVLVSGGGTNLQALIDAQGETLTHGAISLVVSDKEGAYALTRAQKAGIPHLYIPRGEGFEPALSNALSEYKIDLIVLAGFLSILSADFVRAWDKRILNIHPSLIPSFC